MMQAYRYLEQVAQSMESLEDPDEINKVIDELEYIFDALDPEFQELASELIAKLNERLRSG